jgi:hypothetical protein
MIVRDHNGGLILSACRQLSNCRDALGAELNAVLEGLKVAMHWCNLRLICSEVLNLLNKEGVDPLRQRTATPTALGHRHS